MIDLAHAAICKQQFFEAFRHLEGNAHRAHALQNGCPAKGPLCKLTGPQSLTTSPRHTGPPAADLSANSQALTSAHASEGAGLPLWLWDCLAKACLWDLGSKKAKHQRTGFGSVKTGFGKHTKLPCLSRQMKSMEYTPKHTYEWQPSDNGIFDRQKASLEKKKPGNKKKKPFYLARHQPASNQKLWATDAREPKGPWSAMLWPQGYAPHLWRRPLCQRHFSHPCHSQTALLGAELLHPIALLRKSLLLLWGSLRAKVRSKASASCWGSDFETTSERSVSGGPCWLHISSRPSQFLPRSFPAQSEALFEARLHQPQAPSTPNPSSIQGLHAFPQASVLAAGAQLGQQAQAAWEQSSFCTCLAIWAAPQGSSALELSLGRSAASCDHRQSAGLRLRSGPLSFQRPSSHPPAVSCKGQEGGSRPLQFAGTLHGPHEGDCLSRISTLARCTHQHRGWSDCLLALAQGSLAKWQARPLVGSRQRPAEESPAKRHLSFCSVCLALLQHLALPLLCWSPRQSQQRAHLPPQSPHCHLLRAFPQLASDDCRVGLSSQKLHSAQ